MGQLWF